MRINVFGLGYVGCVSAACLAREGHHVTGLDVDPLKLEMIAEGRSPVVEPGLEELIGAGVTSGHLSTSETPGAAELSMICVGTPSNGNGSLALRYVERVSMEIGHWLRHVPEHHVVCVRSTVLPGTVDNVVIPALERESGKQVGRDFGVSMNPEFMREGTSIRDYHQPPITIIGEWDAASGDRVECVYRGIDAPLVRVPIRVAEMAKYVSNAFHALKVSFANEVGNLSKALGVDSHEVMDVFCRDTKLNLSPYYLKPGFAFGGSCLPKDLRALLYEIKKHDLDSPVLSSILPSNQNQIESAFRTIHGWGRKKVGLLGLSFKPGSDDLRESPTVDLAERLLGKGYDLRIYDREVALAKIFGSNKRYIEKTIPHVSHLMRETIDEVVDHGDVVVVAKNDSAFATALESVDNDKIVFDLVRALNGPDRAAGSYEGICW